MVRGRLAALIAVVGLMAAIPVAARRSKAEEPRATDTTGALSVVIPSGWQASDAQMMGTKLLLFGPQYDGFRVNITLMTEQVGSLSLSDYMRVSEANAPRLITQYELVSKGSAKLGGLPAMEMVYRGAMGTPPRKLQFRAVFAIKDGTAYILTFTAPPAVFDKYVKTSDVVISSVEWKQRERTVARKQRKH